LVAHRVKGLTHFGAKVALVSVTGVRVKSYELGGLELGVRARVRVRVMVRVRVRVIGSRSGLGSG
jgi:hypothetical protein